MPIDRISSAASSQFSASGYFLAIMTACVLLLCWITIAARLRIRYKEKSGGRDDVAMFGGLIFFTLFAAWIFAALDNYILRSEEHGFWSLTERNKAGLYYFLSQVTYTVASVNIRLSIYFTLLRIAQKRWHRIVIYSAIGFMFLTALLTSIVLVLSGTHIQVQFEHRSLTSNSSDTLRIVIFIFSLSSALEDLLIVVMPYLMLNNLQRRRSERLELIVLLALGGGAIVANIARTPFLPGISESGPKQRLGLYVCSVCELGIGILAGSAVTLRTTLRRCWQRTRRQETQNIQTQNVQMPPVQSQ